MTEPEREVETVGIEEPRIMECYEFLKERNEKPSEAALIALVVYFIISKSIINPDCSVEEIAQDTKEMILSMRMYVPPSIMN